MKKFSLYTLALCLAIFTFVSCSEKDRAFTEIQDAEQGAIPRLVEGVNGQLDFEHPNNPDSSFISFTVEFYDNNNGNNVTEYEWSASYGDLFGPAVIRTFTAADFSPNADGLPQLSVNIPFTEIFDALGMTIDDFLLTTNFVLDAKLRTNSGQEFGFDNSGPTILGQPTFAALFRVNPVPVIKKPCISDLVGNYEAAVTVTNQMASIGWDDCGGNTWNGTVRIEAEHDPTTFDVGSYVIFSTDPTAMIENEDASFGVYRGCYGIADDGGNLPLGDLRISESCGIMAFTGASQWGEVWTYTLVEVNGPDLTLGMVNDYGEGGEVILTRTDGTTWQTDLACDGC